MAGALGGAVHMSAGPVEASDAAFPGAGGTSDYELPCVGAGNQT